jgi:hypothetical protein
LANSDEASIHAEETVSVESRNDEARKASLLASDESEELDKSAGGSTHMAVAGAEAVGGPTKSAVPAGPIATTAGVVGEEGEGLLGDRPLKPGAHGGS